jgi:hypothetical protein
MTVLAYLVTWVILGVGITLWAASFGIAMFGAAIIGLIVGGIANLLAWMIFSSGFNPFSW